MIKTKVFNDPVYGFISVPYNKIFKLIENPRFQRLRRIRQLGLTSYVYPGAIHTRFAHAIGAFHLMQEAISVLRLKGHKITSEEEDAVSMAILLHDIGHGPYSHSLEHFWVEGANHEDFTTAIITELNHEFGGALDIASEIFNKTYPKKFLQQLVSSQLDVDRLDYLTRDSFFTGVVEGVVGYNRILKMINIKDNHIVLDAKGIYPVEKFLEARRMMYWQVYLHKTVIGAEQLLYKVLERARDLVRSGKKLEASPGLLYFLEGKEKFNGKLSEEALRNYQNIDDFDIFMGIKSWTNSGDKVLEILCDRLLNRNLLKSELLNEAVPEERYAEHLGKAAQLFNISLEDAAYLVFTGSTSNNMYSNEGEWINILQKNGETQNIFEASDHFSSSIIGQPIVKHYFCYPKEISLP